MGNIVKRFLIVLLLIQTGTSFAKDNLLNPMDNGWTIARLCFTRGALAIPKQKSVYGINIGVPVSYNYDCFQKIYGLDIAFVAVESKADGFQLGILNFSDGSNGVQMSCANAVKRFSGVQMAVANMARNSSVFQLGILNFARKKTKGFQIGLLNFNDDGFLPIFPIINFGF